MDRAKETNPDKISKERKVTDAPVDLNAVLESLPEDKRDVIMSAMYAIEQKSYSGPLPAPEDFAEYEKILPGSTDRILKMAEKQVDHRISSDNKIIDNTYRQSGRGQILGAILVVMFGVISLILGLTGHDSLAKYIGVTTVIGLAVVFVLNKIPLQNDKKIDD
jgi:uncharacterized membrane protein